MRGPTREVECVRAQFIVCARVDVRIGSKPLRLSKRG